MLWSALGKAVFVPATHEKVAPNTTTYWFLRVPTSAMGRTRGLFVPSASPIPRHDEVLEYIVASNRSGITWAQFPMLAQLREIPSSDLPSNQPNVDSNLIAQSTTYVILQSEIPSAPPATGQPGAVGISGPIVVAPGVPSPTYSDGQFAVGHPYEGEGANQGLGGLFTAGVAGSKTNQGHGVISFSNATGPDTWTQIGDSGLHNINGVHNTVISILDKTTNGAGKFNEIGCAMDAGANWGCGGGLYGNAAATPFPGPESPNPSPTVYPSAYGGPAVIAQSGSAPYPQAGNVLIDGKMEAQTHNTCGTAAGMPCEFQWSMSVSAGVGTVSIPVPPGSVCTISATVTPVDSMHSNNVLSTWITVSAFPPILATVHAQNLTGQWSGTFTGNGNCN